MKIFLDTEFYEDGKTIDLMSIGMVREDGQELYLINAECDWRKPIADHWHRENTLPSVMPHLLRNPRIPLGSVAPPNASIAVSKEELRRSIRAFTNSGSYHHAGVFLPHVPEDPPEFWAYYGDYDWVVLCQLFGRMMDLPEGWPMYCRDFKQLCDQHDHTPDDEGGDGHNALDDAKWLKREFDRFVKLELADLPGDDA